VTDVASACAAVPGQVRRYLLNADATESMVTILQRDLSGSSPERCELALLIGPEGGWSQDEVEVAQRLGFVPVQLGPRVLRTETAPLAALAIAQALCGDLR